MADFDTRLLRTLPAAEVRTLPRIESVEVQRYLSALLGYEIEDGTVSEFCDIMERFPALAPTVPPAWRSAVYEWLSHWVAPELPLEETMPVRRALGAWRDVLDRDGATIARAARLRAHVREVKPAEALAPATPQEAERARFAVDELCAEDCDTDESRASVVTLARVISRLPFAAVEAHLGRIVELWQYLWRAQGVDVDVDAAFAAILASAPTPALAGRALHRHVQEQAVERRPETLAFLESLAAELGPSEPLAAAALEVGVVGPPA